jgi:hypothetical protein
MMKIRIESTGLPQKTKIYNAETGEAIKGFRHVVIEMTSEKKTCWLEFQQFEIIGDFPVKSEAGSSVA